jgi:hypothetical protein
MQRAPQSESPWHSTVLAGPTTKEQRAPASHFSAACSPAVSMQLESSSQSAEQEAPQVPLQLFSCGHSQLH